MSTYRLHMVSGVVLWRVLARGVWVFFIAILGVPGFSGGMAAALGQQPITVSFTDVSAQAGLFDAAWPHDGTAFMLDPPGVQAVDVDGDGWIDIFVAVDVPDVPDRFYRNNGDGTFTEAAAAWGIADLNATRSALFLDYDNDGLLDLVLGNRSGDSSHKLRLYHQRSSGAQFDNVTYAAEEPFQSNILPSPTLPGPGHPDGMAAADLDDDGYLDLAAVSLKGGSPPTAIDAFYRNQRDGTFLEARAQLGLSGTSYTWQAHFADFDLDGRIDLFCANDFGVASRVYRNTAPWSLVDVGGLPDGTDMGVAIADYDNDGDFDVYVTDLAFLCPYTDDGIGVNQLFNNQLIPSGTLSFINKASFSGTIQSALGWGCTFFDYDNDGWQDLAVASANCNSRLFRNLGDGTFDSVGPAVGFSPAVIAGGVVAFDYDRDGDQDLLLMGDDMSPLLYRNDGGNANHWLVVDPVFAISNRQAIGTQVRATVGGMTLLRQISAGCSFKSQEPDEAHFGLDTATLVQSVHIVWPDNSWEEHLGVAADQIVTYTRVQGDFDWDGSVGVGADLATFVSVLIGQTTGSNELLRADMNFDGTVDSSDIQPFVSAVLAGP